MSSALDLDGSSKGTKFATSHSLWDFLDPAVKEGYRDQVKALASLQQHIVKTIGNYYSTIAEEHDVAKQLALLQARLPDVQDLRPTQDFLQAVSSINAPFTDYWVNKMEDEAVFGKPDWKTDFPDGIKINCFYLIKSARPDGWTPDQKVEKKIKEILDSNPWAKKMTEKAQDFKKKEMEKSSPSTPPSTSFSTGKAVYPLYDSFILDSGSDTHICNNRSRFLDYTAPAEPEELFAGDSQLQILGYGTVRMKLEEGGLFQLNEVAFVPKFHTSHPRPLSCEGIQLESTIWTRL
ncbi:hypothetical protein HRG_013186 [Hirsutella rhossiliensis]